MRRAWLLAGLLLTGCDDQRIANSTCDDIATEAIRISKGGLVSLDQRTETSRTDRSLVCHGRGLYSNGSLVNTRFQAFFNSDGVMLIRYDVSEAQAAAIDNAEREANEQANQMLNSLNRKLDGAGAQ